MAIASVDRADAGRIALAEPPGPRSDAELSGSWGTRIRRLRFTRKYFAHLDTEFESLCSPKYKADNADAVAELRAHHARSPSWENNHRFEYIVMAGVDPLILRQRLALYRVRLKDLVGPEREEAMAASFAVPENADDAAERTIALGLLSEIQRMRHVRSEFEILRNRLFAMCLAMGLLLGASFSALVWEAIHQRHTYVPFHVLVAGLLGGYFSVLLRLGALRWCFEYNANYQQVDRLFWNIFSNFLLSMFEGAVGAFVLYTIFLAGILRGTLFPTFDTSTAGFETIFCQLPSSNSQLAMLLLWSIVAGFSERLVPDFLMSLTAEVKRTDAPKADG